MVSIFVMNISVHKLYILHYFFLFLYVSHLQFSMALFVPVFKFKILGCRNNDQKISICKRFIVKFNVPLYLKKLSWFGSAEIEHSPKKTFNFVSAPAFALQKQRFWTNHPEVAHVALDELRVM